MPLILDTLVCDQKRQQSGVNRRHESKAKRTAKRSRICSFLSGSPNWTAKRDPQSTPSQSYPTTLHPPEPERVLRVSRPISRVSIHLPLLGMEGPVHPKPALSSARLRPGALVSTATSSRNCPECGKPRNWRGFTGHLWCLEQSDVLQRKNLMQRRLSICCKLLIACTLSFYQTATIFMHENRTDTVLQQGRCLQEQSPPNAIRSFWILLARSLTLD